MFLYLQIIVLLLVSIAVCTLPKRKWIAIFLSILLGLFITLQLVSMNMDGNLIDYRFYEHINLKDIWSVKDFFLTEILVFSAVFIIICAFLYFISRWVRSLKFPKWVLGLSIVIGIIIMCIPQGPLNNIYGIANLKTAKSIPFTKALEDVGIDPSTYVTADKITATPGKNIIVLSLESLERGYLEPPLQNLTPTLQGIAQHNTYFNMRENLGSRWTSGSIYTTITGFPCLFRSSSNDIFQTTTASKISSVGDVLNAAGYKPTYLLGNKEFSGVSDMLNGLGFEVKSEEDFEKQYPEVSWGLHDKDLFEEAKKEIADKSKGGEPFALFMSTISGHFPNGIYDKRMESVLPKQDSHIEFMASAVDYYINDLLTFLKKENLLKNTSIYIFPDHQLMGGNGGVVKKFSKERGLYLITTAEEKDLSLKTSQPIYQIDIPRIIIDGAKIKTNALFLTDFLKGEKKNDYIRQHKKQILALNEASLKTLKQPIKPIDYTKGITLSLSNDQTIEVGSASKSDQKNYILNIERNKLYIIDFDEDLHNFSYRILGGDYKRKDLQAVFSSEKNIRLVFSVSKENKIHTYLTKSDDIGVARMGDKKVVFDKDDLKIFDDWSLIIPEKEKDPSKIFLRSTGYSYLATKGNSAIYIGKNPKPIHRGLNLLYVENDSYKVKYFDTYAHPETIPDFIKAVDKLIEDNAYFAIVAHDTAGDKFDNYKKELQALGFSKLIDLENREAYIAYHTNKTLFEYTDPASISRELKLGLIENPEKAAIRKDKKRFIAHASGKVNNLTYTNSLEALDYNYNKGFRLFELDIIKTSDNKYVAAHDWEFWAKRRDYKGTLPPTEAEFLEHNYKGLTPLTIDQINTWFKEHTDAILVTDKVNKPKELYEKFDHKSRLMMELFTVDALKEAQSLKLMTPIASHSVLRNNKGHELETLQKYNIEYITISRKLISENSYLLKQLKNAGIKTYVYHINFEKGKDEQYVVNYEMDYIYGMYADQWDFGN